MKIVEENFASIDPRLLLEPQRYQEVEDIVVSIDAAHEPDSARDFALLLSDKLEIAGDRMEPGLSERYLRLLRALRLYALRLVSDQEKERFFREQILDVFQLDFVDVKEQVDFCLKGYYKAPELLEQTRKVVLKGLEANVQTLGTEEMRFGVQAPPESPILSKWLLDYKRSNPAIEKKMSQVLLEEGKYISQSQNVQRLQLSDRKVLEKVLAFYDWLRLASLKYDFSLPGQRATAAQPTSETTHILIPQEIINLVENLRAKKISDVKLRPQPKTPSRPTPSVMTEIRRPAIAATPMQFQHFAQRMASGKSASGAPMSLSEALANAGQGAMGEAGSIRLGKKQPVVPKPPVKADTTIPTPKQPPLAAATPPPTPPSALSAPSSSPPISAKPQMPMMPKTAPIVPQTPSSVPPSYPPVREPVPMRSAPSVQQSTPAPSQTPPAGSVVDLSRKTPLNISEIGSPQELQKVALADLRRAGFDKGLGQIKQRITEISKSQGMAVKEIANLFYRSPVYNLYVTMAVAVMNDASADQQLAFEKVTRMYETSGKEHLTREEFLSLNKFKKDLSSYF